MRGFLALATLAFLCAVPAAGARPRDAALELDVSGPSLARPNTAVTYVVTVTNVGDEAAAGADLTLAHDAFPRDARGRLFLPRAVSIEASGGSCERLSAEPASYHCTVAGLEPDASATFTSVELARAPASGCRSQVGRCAIQFSAMLESPAGTVKGQAVTELVAAGTTPAPAPPTGAVQPGRRGGKIVLGVLGGAARFQQLTGQRSLTRHVIAGWDQLPLFASMGPLPMLGINPGTAISPLQIARGSGDAYLIALNQAVARWAKPIYIRPLPEMNGHWNAYCAYDKNGRFRGPDHATAAFRKAFARIYVIVHGGPAVNAQLAQLGLPPVAAALASNPLARVIWNPQGYGSPDLPGNRAAAYFPGSRYVDVVGDDLYDIGGRPQWAAAEALYRAHPTKPFAFPEWGLWNLDEPSYVDRMAAFVRGHTRVELISYYSGRPGSIWDLASKPRSRAEYRRVIVPLGRS